MRILSISIFSVGQLFVESFFFIDYCVSENSQSWDFWTYNSNFDFEYNRTKLSPNNFTTSMPLCQVWFGQYRDEPFVQVQTIQSNQKIIANSLNAIRNLYRPRRITKIYTDQHRLYCTVFESQLSAPRYNLITYHSSLVIGFVLKASAFRYKPFSSFGPVWHENKGIIFEVKKIIKKKLVWTFHFNLHIQTCEHFLYKIYSDYSTYMMYLLKFS